MLTDPSGQPCAVQASEIHQAATRASQGAAIPSLPKALKFSSRPFDLIMRVEVGADSSDWLVQWAVLAEDPHSGLNVELDAILDRRSDHVVVNGTWHPFAPGALEETRALVARLGLEPGRRASLRQYQQLRELAQDDPFVRLVERTGGEPRRDEPTPIATNVEAVLYPYQQDGLRWISTLADESLGGILADEMGLGKTLQVIAFLAGRSEARPSLVVAPATLMENWRRELRRFTPNLRVIIHHGPLRTGFPSDLGSGVDVVLTSYGTLVNDLSLLKMVDWGLVALDEAQNIKNPSTSRARAAKLLPRKVSLAITGTPVENSLVDLWSLLDFAVSGLLGTEARFARDYGDSLADAERVNEISGPFVLRRSVKSVQSQLPPRLDIPQALTFEDDEAAAYEQLRHSVSDGFQASRGFLELIRLRQFCTHPSLLQEGYPPSDPTVTSAKYLHLVRLLREIRSLGQKAIVFVGFTRGIELMLKDLPSRVGMSCFRLDGHTPIEDRQQVIDHFTAASDPSVLIMNPRAGGVGLNVTAATNVIHYTPQWNPAIRDQASARAYRIGQTHTVRIYYLYYAGTVEEVMMDRLERKKAIAERAVPPDEDLSDAEDLLRAIQMTPLRGQNGGR